MSMNVFSVVMYSYINIISLNKMFKGKKSPGNQDDSMKQ